MVNMNSKTIDINQTLLEGNIPEPANVFVSQTDKQVDLVNLDREEPLRSLNGDSDDIDPVPAIVDHPTENKFEESNEEGKSLLIENSSTYKDKPSLYVEDNEPCFYKVKKNLVTPTLAPSNLPKLFNNFPIHGRPKSKADLPEFYRGKIREYVGHDLNDEEFDQLSKYCSPEHLKTGDEIKMGSACPTYSPWPALGKIDEKREIDKAADVIADINLCVIKKHKIRLEKDTGNHYNKKLKYRGIRMMPLSTMEEDEENPSETIDKPLEPGQDLLYRVRIYRPYNTYSKKNRMVNGRTRHSVFCCDVVVLGRQPLWALRERLVCPNDVGMRVDLSHNPDHTMDTCAKDVFPSGFLFINNVFYVDNRSGCHDYSAGLRAWASARGLGDYRAVDMGSVTMQDIPLRLGHPELYVHQGNCEHLFTFSEIRLLGPSDPLLAATYPCHSGVAQHQTVYCTTCAEFGAKWIVVGSSRVPFDPAFFCETCFKLYLYKDGKKIGDFKAYSYRGNELNLLKPQC